MKLLWEWREVSSGSKECISSESHVALTTIIKPKYHYFITNSSGEKNLEPAKKSGAICKVSAPKLYIKMKLSSLMQSISWFLWDQD